MATPVDEYESSANHHPLFKKWRGDENHKTSNLAGEGSVAWTSKTNGLKTKEAANWGGLHALLSDRFDARIAQSVNITFAVLGS
jgi:hypothetical protein